MNDLFLRRADIDWDQIHRNSYLRRIPALGELSGLEFTAPVTLFVGENGTGKSTLLEALAVAYGFNPEGGTKNYSFSTYDSHSQLCRAIRLTRGYRRTEDGYFLRAESFYNVATKEMEYVDPRHPSQRYHDRSHGESFLALFQRRLGSRGIFLFDEPEAALSQFIIATHSPILLAIPGAVLLSFDDGAIHPCTYQETGSYQITRLFINDRERVLRELLADPE